jgi:hypothetical protein
MCIFVTDKGLFNIFLVRLNDVEKIYLSTLGVHVRVSVPVHAHISATITSVPEPTMQAYLCHIFF